MRVGHGAAHPRQRGRRGRRAQGASGVRRRASVPRTEVGGASPPRPERDCPDNRAGSGAAPGCLGGSPAKLGSDLLNICSLFHGFVRRNFTFQPLRRGKGEEGSQRLAQKDTSPPPLSKVVESMENRGRAPVYHTSNSFLHSPPPLCLSVISFLSRARGVVVYSAR